MIPAVKPISQTSTANLLQPAAPASYLLPTASAPQLQPAATAPMVQPAATAPKIQPAATAPQIQPAVGGTSVPSLPGAETYSYNGQTYTRPSTSYNYSQPGTSFNFMNGSSLGSTGYTPPSPNQVAGYQASAPQLPQLPQVGNSYLSDLEKTVASYYNLSPEEIAAQRELNELNESYLTGAENTRNKPIAMEFITGQLESQERMAALKEIPLQQKLALAQAKRTAALDASKFALEREDARLDRESEASKPVMVGDGGALIDPSTGKVIYQNERDGAYSLGIDPITGQPYVLNTRTGQLGGTGSSLGSGGTYGLNFNTGSTGMRTDRHNNPTAFTTDIARQAGLVEGVDYVAGDPFGNGQYQTAKLLGDPIATTIKVIDSIGFYTQSGQPRWSYIDQIPEARNWSNLSYDQKRQVIAQMYQREGGNGSLLGTGTTSNFGNDLVGQIAMQVTQNPNLLSQLPDAQKKAVIARLAQMGATIPQELSAAAQEKQRSLQVMSQTISQIEQIGSAIGWSGVGGLFQGSIQQFLATNFGSGSQQEQMLRSFIGNLQAAIALQRGGTSFTTNEQVLLEQYTPTINDSPQVIQSKLAALKTFFSSTQQAYSGTSGGFSSGTSYNDPLGIR